MAKMVLLAVMAKTKMLANKENGFSLIELLVVLLIAGILLSFSTYSINLVNEQQQNSLITQLKNQIQVVKHKATLLNWPMRLRHVIEKDKQRIATERFDFEKQSWQIDSSIKSTVLDDEKVNMDVQFLLVMPNGFVTDSSICIDNECVQSVKK